MFEEFEKTTNNLDTFLVYENGGRGSGNFGHAGRPGEVGGSSSKESSTPSPLSQKEYEKAVEAFPKTLSQTEASEFEWYSFSPDHQASATLNKEPTKEWVKSGKVISGRELVERYEKSDDPEKHKILADLTDSKAKKTHMKKASTKLIDPDDCETIQNQDLREYYEAGGEPLNSLYVLKKNSAGEYSLGYQSTIPTKEKFELMAIVDKAIREKGISFKKDITVERIVPVAMLERMMKDLNSKGSYTQQGFTSVSAFPMSDKGKDTRMSFGDKKIKITIPAGTKLGFMAGFADTDSAKEQYEILLPSRSKFVGNGKIDDYDLSLVLSS